MPSITPPSPQGARISKDLHARLSGTANERSRSLNAEMVARLEDSYSSFSERFSVLKKRTLDEKAGNDALYNAVHRLEVEMKDLLSSLYTQFLGSR